MARNISGPKRVAPRIGVRAVIAGSILAGIGLAAFYAFKYDLMGPLPVYDDCSYYYILGASGIMDGEYLPRFAHPGLNVMLIYGWGFSLLHALHLVPTFSTAELLASNDPIPALANLFFWGRILSILLGICYLLLVYIAARRISGSRAIGAALVFLNLLLVGLIEQVFVVRPELVSAIFVLCGFLICFEMNKARDFKVAMVLSAAAGLIMNNLFYSMVLMIVLYPVFLFTIRNPLDLHYGADRKKYLISLILLTALNIILVLPWTDLLLLSYLRSFIPTQYALLFSLGFVSLQKVLVVATGGGILFSVSLCFNICSERFRNRARNSVLLILSTTAGFLLAFNEYLVNGAGAGLTWAKRMLASATIETLNLVFFKTAFAEKKFDWDLSFLNNLEAGFIAGHMKIFLLIVALGFIFSRWRERVLLLIYAVPIYGFALVLETRGLKTAAYFYQIYFLVGLTLMAAFSLKMVASVSLPARNLWAIGLALVLLVSMDCYRSSEYRTTLFSQRNPPALSIAVLEYWGKDFHYGQVLQRRYCRPGLDRSACLIEIGREFTQLRSKPAE